MNRINVWPRQACWGIAVALASWTLQTDPPSGDLSSHSRQQPATQAGSKTVDSGRILVGNARLILGTQENRSASIRLGDWDRDGDLDVVVANGRHWPQQNFVLFNQGRARFNRQQRLGDDWRTSYATEPADLDGDGDLDLAIGNDMAPNRLMLNDGDGVFRPGGSFGEPASLRSLLAVDLDQDGDVDLLATCRGQANQIFLNQGDAKFQAGKSFGQPGDSTIDVVAGDFNEDGHLDLALANRDQQPNQVLFNDGELNFPTSLQLGKRSNDSRSIAVADMNRDGHLDLIVGNLGQRNVIYLGDGTGKFPRTVEFGRPAGQSYALAVADLNGNGNLDVVVGNVGQTNTVSFLTWAKTPDRDAPSVNEIDFGDETAATYGLAVGDLDHDGFLDVVTANSGSYNRLFLNRPAPLPRRD